VSSEALEQRSILKVRGGCALPEEDWVAVEEPLELIVQGEPLAVLMRTPGHDLELAAGFALTEGLVRSLADIGTMRHCAGDPGRGEGTGENTLEISLVPGAPFDRESLRRGLVVSAACGVCGRASIDALRVRARRIDSEIGVPADVLRSLPDRMATLQGAFRRTGALHAAVLFDPAGQVLVGREDVGRHNAVDKAVGRAVLDGLALEDAILMVSGRTSFEIIQKAAVARLPIVCAISGPTTLAIETARTFRITLVNFLRDGGFNVSSCPERILGL
jgi:FdhD protein